MDANWLKEIGLDTSASEADRRNDVWDNDNCCNYSQDGAKLLDAENYPEEVKVKDGTRIICDQAFAFQNYMDEDRRIGDSVPDEERVAFLDKISLPSSVTHIGRQAFRECGWVRSIRLPLNLLSIGEEAFVRCWELKGISCPAGLLSIGDGAFGECFSLASLRLNKGLKAIGAGAFYCCESLEDVVLPSSLEFVGEDAFAGSGVKRLYVPKSERSRLCGILPSELLGKVRNIH